jgi:hypothetical protein
MFRSLSSFYEGFADQTVSSGNPHPTHIDEQNKYFQTLPNIVLSNTNGLAGFGKAIQTTDLSGSQVGEEAIPYPDDIFRSDVGPQLQAMSKQCSTNSLDALIAMKQTGKVGCGWAYTPPPANSPFPIVSKGAVGTKDGALAGFQTPEYKKWFFDLQEAKRKMLLDKCKALYDCNDVDDDAYRDQCGYCIDTGRGIPIGPNGRPMYPEEDTGNCSVNSLVTRKASCPPPPPEPQPGRNPICDPDINGRRSIECVRQKVLDAGCSTNGTLAIALTSQFARPDDYVAGVRDNDAMKLYQRVANPPMDLSILQNGSATATAVLREAGRLAAHAQQPANSSLGASARDLCLQRGAVAAYDECRDLPDSAPTPINIKCLQKFFMDIGGNQRGTDYPSDKTRNFYDTKFTTLGEIKQYWNQLITKIKAVDRFTDYKEQRDSIQKLKGITLERMIRRAPFQAGIETFWFIASHWNPHVVKGFLKRTIEPDFIRLQGVSGISQLGGISHGCCIQLTDVRAKQDAMVRFTITVDDGFWVAVNQPADIDKRAMPMGDGDEPGLFNKMGLRGPSTFRSSSCSQVKAATPNIVKLYYEDAGGGGNYLHVTTEACSAAPTPFEPRSYSLTCEARAPFLTYEVGKKSGVFEELRNPGMFSQFMNVRNLQPYVRPEERANVPGNKPFIRIVNETSLLDMYNITFQSWKSMSFVIRMGGLPTKDTLLKFAVGSSYLSLVLTNNGSSAKLSVEYNYGDTITFWSFGVSPLKNIDTGFSLELGQWYYFQINNMKNGFDIFYESVDAWLANGAGKMTSTSSTTKASLWSANGSWAPAPGQVSEACTIMMGTNGFARRGDWPGCYTSSSFMYDLAWMHFFDQYITGDDVKRDIKADWVYTEFPESYNNYSTNNE